MPPFLFCQSGRSRSAAAGLYPPALSVSVRRGTWVAGPSLHRRGRASAPESQGRPLRSDLSGADASRRYLRAQRPVFVRGPFGYSGLFRYTSARKGAAGPHGWRQRYALRCRSGGSYLRPRVIGPSATAALRQSLRRVYRPGFHRTTQIEVYQGKSKYARIFQKKFFLFSLRSPAPRVSPCGACGSYGSPGSTL